MIEDEDLAEALLHHYAIRVGPDHPEEMFDLLRAALGDDLALQRILTPVIAEVVEELIVGAGCGT